MNPLSNERLEYLLTAPGPAGREEQNLIVRELLALRKEREAAVPAINVIFKDGWPIPETVGVVAGSEKLPDGAHDFYAAPPAQPVAVPDEITERIGGLDWGWQGEFNRGWNACRAVMLQSFGNSEQLEPVSAPYKLVGEVVAWNGPQRQGVHRTVDFRWIDIDVQPGTKLYALNCPVIPDGWIKCSERLPDPKSDLRVCVYTPTPHDDVRYRFVPASLFKAACSDATHWQYMTPPAAPGKEG